MGKADYTRCPDCHQKQVVLRLRPLGEDHWHCRNPKCDFEFYVEQDYEMDREAMDRWADENGFVILDDLDNPRVRIWGTPEEIEQYRAVDA